MARKKTWFDKLKGMFRHGKPAEPEDPFGYEGPEGAGENGVANTCGMTCFEYRYIGSIGGNSYSYEISFDTPPVFSFEGMEYPFEKSSIEVDEETAARVAALYENHKLWKWDGFSRSARHVLDGDGFSLALRFRDGKSMYAHGSNAFPNGYPAFRQEMEEIFQPLRERVIEIENRKIIEKGVSGKVTSVLANFIQRGKSGRDRYELFVLGPDVRADNAHIQVKSESGAIFETESFNICRPLPDTEDFFAKVDALVRKYDIMQWYGWDRAAEDYNNEEWFQISICYEDGSISAMGTEHPENYKAFREGMIRLMKEAAERMKPEEEETE